MRRRIGILVAMVALVGALVVWAAAGRRPAPVPGPDGVISAETLRAVAAKIRPLQAKLAKPGPHDWLANHKESGQTFAQYLRSSPTIPDRKRRVIYVQPLGDFTKAQRKVVDQAADLMRRHFNLPVKIRDPLALALVPAKARRTHPRWGMKQILTTYVLDELLPPRMPEDAFAYIALTASDLWPGEGWNFVFGQASFHRRVGVWSMYRYGDPAKGPAAYRVCLKRTIQTATHELGHTFSISHCIAYECNMCGSNNLPEADGHPVTLCAECLPKICWATQTEPVKRYRKLHAFYEAAGLKPEAAAYAKLLAALGAKPTTAPASRPGG